MSDEKRKETKDAGRAAGAPAAADEKNTASRARNRTVLLSPEHIGQIRANLSEEPGETPPGAPREGGAGNAGKWSFETEKTGRARRDTEKEEGAAEPDDGFKPVGRGGPAAPAGARPLNAGTAAPEAPRGTSNPTFSFSAEGGQASAPVAGTAAGAVSPSQPTVPAGNEAPAPSGERSPRPRANSAFHRVIGAGEAPSGAPAPREQPRESFREPARRPPERFETPQPSAPLNGERAAYQPPPSRPAEPPPQQHAKAEHGSVRIVSRGQKTKVVGFLVSYDTDPLGEVLELRVGRWLVTSKPTDQGDYILIDDPSISPLHAILRSGADGQVQILDQLSESGSGIVRAGKTEEEGLTGALAQVNHGDSMRLGNRHFAVCLLPRAKGEKE